MEKKLRAEGSCPGVWIREEKSRGLKSKQELAMNVGEQAAQAKARVGVETEVGRF